MNVKSLLFFFKFIKKFLRFFICPVLFIEKLKKIKVQKQNYFSFERNKENL